MVQRTAIASAVIWLGLVLGCASTDIQASSDYDTAIDFSKYKTFAWAPRANPDAPVSLLDENIHGAINRNMLGKGYTEADSTDADLIVLYKTSEKQQVQVFDDGGWGWWGTWGGPTDVYQYEQGTLVVSLIDRGRNQYVWQGTASGAVTDGTGENVGKAVAMMFAHFPTEPTKE